jgi:hypothetical protein
VTCHIAFSNATTAVLCSDSQGSGERSEQHGLEKQFVGSDFLLGVAGSGDVHAELFGELRDARQSDTSLNAANVQQFVERYVETKIHSKARRQIELILVTPPDANYKAVQTFNPEVFTGFGRQKWTACIGSGAEFVHRAFASYERLGICIPFDSLADLIVAVDDAANAAGESLTVNDAFLLGVIAGNKSYLMGDKRIVPCHATGRLIEQWGEAAKRFMLIMQDAKSINASMKVVQELVSSIRTKSLSPEDFNKISKLNEAITDSRQCLEQKLKDYFGWYDDLLGRALQTSTAT